VKIRFNANKPTPKKWLLDLGKVEGKRRQLFFLSERQAQDALKTEARRQKEIGNQWLGLDHRTRRRTLEILGEIAAAGTTLEALWMNRNNPALTANAGRADSRLTIGAAVTQFLDSRRTLNRRPKYIQSVKSTLLAFVKGREEMALDQFTRKDLTDWLAAGKLKPATYLSTVARLQSFFTWATEDQHIKENPSTKLARPIVEMGEIEILTNEQVRLLLDRTRAVRPDLLAYLVLAVFAGTRPDEIERSKWKDIDLIEGTFTIGARASKVRERRIQELHPTALAWLAVCTQGTPDAPLCPPKPRDVIRKIRHSLQIDHWANDICRHTAISHYLNITNDPALVAKQMGNSVKIIEKHYRAVVAKKISSAFWQMLPETPAGAVLAANF
jgi:integrase